MMQVLTLVLGQDFPEVNANAINQAFSLLAAALGLVSFALVLALVEQIVLEVVETNVRTGSPIFEKDHVRFTSSKKCLAADRPKQLSTWLTCGAPLHDQFYFNHAFSGQECPEGRPVCL